MQGLHPRATKQASSAEATDYLIVAVVSFFLAAVPAQSSVCSLASSVSSLASSLRSSSVRLWVASLPSSPLRWSAPWPLPGHRGGDRYHSGRRDRRVIHLFLFSVAPSLIPLGVFLFMSLSTIYATLR